jgi:hypothetical protein
MRQTIHVVMSVVLVLVMSAQSISAQIPADVWKRFAARVDIGSELNVRLNDGRRLRATLVDVRDDAVLLQPKTRIPVPIEAIPYDAIVRMELRKAGHNPAKSVAIGIATGFGVIFGIMAVLAVAIGD